MIPKIIHYCWFGNNSQPQIIRDCIKSWERCCPDYEIKLWNEKNYDVNKVPYVKEAYEKKMWAFVSDYARLDIIYNEGGIYLDTDVELIKSLDELLYETCFVATETAGTGINSGLGFGAEAGHEAIAAMLKEYENRHFVVNGKMDLTACPKFNSEPFLRNGYIQSLFEKQHVLGATILPPSYFDPIDGPSSELRLTAETIGIHRGTCTWYTGLPKLKARIRTTLGLNVVRIIKKTGIKKVFNKKLF